MAPYGFVRCVRPEWFRALGRLLELTWRRSATSACAEWFSTTTRRCRATRSTDAIMSVPHPGRPVFTGGAKFDRAMFTRGADFADTEFAGGVRFGHVEFIGGADFGRAVFTRAELTGAKFVDNDDAIAAKCGADASYGDELYGHG